MEKRLIEIDFPLEEISKESAREKSIRHGHISTLHMWWARKPLAVSRSTIFAALTNASNDQEKFREQQNFIVKLSKWENANNKQLLNQAIRSINDSFVVTPRVLDCFAGGGSIPLEAIRLGCETYALELNPVAVLLLMATLKYPQKYQKINASLQEYPEKSVIQSVSLKADVKKWGGWVLDKATNEIGHFYRENNDREIIVAFIWAKTVLCKNPSCKAEIPLMYQLWLSRKPGKKVALRLLIDKNKEINFAIVKGEKIDFDPSRGTIKFGKARCPICEAGLDAESVRKDSREGNMGERLVALVLREEGKRGKTYRIATQEDEYLFNKSEAYLKEKIKNWKWDFNPVPNEYISSPSIGPPNPPKGAFWVHLGGPVLHGMLTWGDLFNNRQKLALITFMEKTRLSYEQMIEKGYEPDYAKAVVTYLALALDRMIAYCSKLGYWHVTRELLNPAFQRGALAFSWNCSELNPFNGKTAEWNSALKWILLVIDHCSKISKPADKIILGTATRLPFPDNFFDAVITDPPYFDNCPYSDLADFFYVWLKRTVGDLYPDLFSTPLSPKSQEIIQNSSLLRRGTKIPVSDYEKLGIKDKAAFEIKLTKSFSEISRVLKSDGIAVIVFAHRLTEAWETVINSLLKADLTLIASWPIHTEMKERMRARGSAALASSIYMCCRKRLKEESVYFNELKPEIDNQVKLKLNQFWEQGIHGADFFISAIGPAVEVFGKYSRVERLSGEEVTVQELLEYVRKIVSEFALERVLRRSDLGGVDSETRFYLLWRWTFGNARVPFDDGIKLSRPMGIELTDIWDRGELIKKEKEYVRVLGPKERENDEKFLRKKSFTSMIDVLHRVLISWDKGERQDVNDILVDTGYLKNELFWQTAQALSEILPEGDKEKQLIQGFLYGRETYFKKEKRDKTLFEFMEERKE